jgi:hypothetical protein
MVGGYLISLTPSCETNLWTMCRCNATKTSSCFYEHLVWPTELFAIIIPSLLNKTINLWFLLLEQIPWEWFLLN